MSRHAQRGALDPTMWERASRAGNIPACSAVLRALRVLLVSPPQAGRQACAFQQSRISLPVADQTPLRFVMWPSAFSRAPMR